VADYFTLEPESSPTWGENTEVDTSVHPPIVSRLHLEFIEWLGDDLLWTYPSYVVTENLAAKLAESGLSGFEFRPVEVTVDPHGIEDDETLDLPEFRWLHITGTAGRDDVGVTDKGRIVVSETALTAFRQGNLEYCEIEQYTEQDES
jgi:hypothetical protein